jgi:hypothetical protein
MFTRLRRDESLEQPGPPAAKCIDEWLRNQRKFQIPKARFGAPRFQILVTPEMGHLASSIRIIPGAGKSPP